MQSERAPTSHSQNLAGLSGEPRTAGGRGSSGHCAETRLPAAPTRATAQPWGGERRARRGALQGWLRSTRRLATCAPIRPVAVGPGPQLGRVGPRPSLKERGSLLPRPSKGSPPRKAWRTGRGPWASATGNSPMLHGLWEGEKRPSPRS